jgi:CTP:phosphocholine cytidylyltransferase-like protein
MNARKVIITAAGLGTSLLSVTKEIPKEMFPLFCIGSNGNKNHFISNHSYVKLLRWNWR